MGEIYARGKTLILKDEPPYKVPKQLTKSFIEALLFADPGEETFIGEVMRELTEQDKLRIKLSAKKIGGGLHQKLCAAASKWAAVVNPDNVWHLEDFRPIYHAEINTSWAHEIILTDASVRFVITPAGVMTFPEFKYHYGVDIIEHINSWLDTQSEVLKEVKRHISSNIIKKRITAVDRNGCVVTRQIIVLESQTPSEWELPQGLQMLCIEND